MLSFDGENNFKVHLKRSIQFSMISKIKRFFSPKLRKTNKKYIQIGCGPNKFENFDNLDFYSSSFAFWKKNDYISHDLRYSLPFLNESYEGCFSEHTLEHLYFDEAQFLIKDIHRILKKGAIFRCTVPGLDLYIENFKKKKNEKYFQKFKSPCDALRDLVHNWGHLSVWDKETLKRELYFAGFSEVKIRKFGEGGNKDLIKDNFHRKQQTIYLEGIK